MIICPTFTVMGPPRTAKNSPILTRGRMIPSPYYRAWFKDAMFQAPTIRIGLERAGIKLPITEPVGVLALFYRDRDTGDLCGYLQALGDWLQSPKMSKRTPGKLSRNGAAIIMDDKQIEHFDGSRRRNDKLFTRIEVTISIL